MDQKDTKYNVINYNELAQEVNAKKEGVVEGKDVSHKEIISSVLAEKHPAFGAIISQTTQKQDDDQHKTINVLPEYAEQANQEIKNEVEKLVDITLKNFNGGVSEAAKREPFVIDMYHDALTEKLVDELKKRNLI